MITAVPVELPLIPTEVADLANRECLSSYISAILMAAQKSFPGCSIALRVECDAEIESDQHIVVEVDATGWSVEDMLLARNRWTKEFCRICPPEKSVVFQIRLVQKP